MAGENEIAALVAAVLIGSEKVMTMGELFATIMVPSAGEMDVTVGGVVSGHRRR